MSSQAWPFVEARKLLARRQQKDVITFETGYGPSGLPHIGTWAEVYRTTLVRRAFTLICPDTPTRLIAFSDDMDGLRKVPDNVPQASMLHQHLGKSLTAVPDPYGGSGSFGEHNNRQFRHFLDRFEFDYDFISATAFYRSGAFDQTLRRVAGHYDAIRALILPTLGAERQRTYSPFLPVCPLTGKILYAPVLEIDPAKDRLLYRHPTLGETETLFTGGHCKLQWKPDWAMRWVCLGVDYEMSGKDLSESVKLASRLCRTVAAEPPVTFTYELNLDENGQKISKSRGNGLALDTWLRYAPQESLAYFMFRRPTAAKKIALRLLPKETDDYLQQVNHYNGLTAVRKLENPAFHIHAGAVPARPRISYSLLTYLASLCIRTAPEKTGADDQSAATLLNALLCRHDQALDPAGDPWLSRLCQLALNYAHDALIPAQKVILPQTAASERALRSLAEALQAAHAAADAESLQTIVFSVGKAHGYSQMAQWFQLLYRFLFGTDAGPRLGSFFRLYGAGASAQLIRDRLDQTQQA